MFFKSFQTVRVTHSLVVRLIAIAVALVVVGSVVRYRLIQSTLRDGIATPVDFFVDPADFARNAALSPAWSLRIGMSAGRVINFRNSLVDTGVDKLLADSLDDYALARSAFLQRRRLQLFDGQLPADEDPFADTDAAPEPVPEPPAPPPAEPPKL